MKKKQITMVEYLNEYGEWVWYALYEKLTEKEAIKLYCKEMGLACGKIVQELDGFYAELNDVRAFKVTLY